MSPLKKLLRLRVRLQAFLQSTAEQTPEDFELAHLALGETELIMMDNDLFRVSLAALY